MDLVDCQPACPFRPADWRWRLANHPVEQRLRSRRRWLDAWVNRAIRFLRAAVRYGDVNHAKLADLDPALAAAVELKFGGDRRLVLELEARLLADQPVETIAARLDLPADVVTTFELLFYDVRPRLTHTDHLLFSAIGPGVYDSNAEDHQACQLKELALFGGPLVVDALFDPRSGGAEASRRQETSAFDHDLADRLGTALAFMALPVDPSTVPVVIRLHALLGEIQRRESAGNHAAVCPPLALTLDLSFTGAVVPDRRPMEFALERDDLPVHVESGIEIRVDLSIPA